MTLGLLSLVSPLGNELVGSEVTQGLVGPDGVVDVLPGQELLVQGGHLRRELHNLIELLRMGALGPLHTAVELGGAGWQYEEAETSALALRLKACLELTTPVHLDGPYREGHPLLESIQEARCCSSCGPGMGLQYIPAGDHVPSSEVLEDNAWEWPDIQGVHPPLAGPRVPSPHTPWACARHKDASIAASEWRSLSGVAP